MADDIFYAVDANGTDTPFLAEVIPTGSPVVNALSPYKTMRPGTGAAALGKAEDDTVTNGHTGVSILARRKDSPAASASADNKFSNLDVSAEGGLWAALLATTTGGCSVYRSIDVDETEEEVKATAGQVYGYYFANLSGALRYLKFYNATAANVTVGTTTPYMTLPLPYIASNAGCGHAPFPVPIAFSTAICIAVTTGLADNDTGAPGANDVVLNVFYK